MNAGTLRIWGTRAIPICMHNSLSVSMPMVCTFLRLKVNALLYRKELMWVYHEGAPVVYPDKWEKFVEPIPVAERGDLLSAYHRR